MGINFEIAFVLIVVCSLIVSLYKELFNPIVAFFIGIVVLCVGGILSPKDVLLGFANEQIAVIILLLIISNIVQKARIVDLVFGYFFRHAKTYNGFLARMMLYVSSSSAFFNNTPLVAMMIPYVHSWSKNHGVSPSKLLIPLSYAAILGGSATLIGTSTNLLVNGMAVENGYTSINIFDFAYVGLPMILIGFIYMNLAGKKLLPDKKDVLDRFEEKSREYLVEATVTENCRMIGKTIAEANLRNLKGLFLVEIFRGRHVISPVTPSTIIEASDILIFAGDTKNVVNLINSDMGLSIPQSNDLTVRERSDVVEVVVAQNSNLINKNVRRINFRSKYDAAIIAVHRNGAKLSGKIGDIVLRAGDVLLLVTGKDIFTRANFTSEFYFISKVNEIYNITRKNRNILIGGIIIAIVLSALKVFPLFNSLLVLLALIIVFKIASLVDIKRSIDFNLIGLAAMALALGKAMLNSGTANFLAHNLIVLMEPFGVMGMLVGIFLITNILASYMTNITAVSIIFPISFALGNQLLSAGLVNGIMPFILIVCYGASANYITPIGYLTNILVYGPGNYTFQDFFKVGLPLVIIHMVMAVAILGLVFDYI